MIPLRTMLQRAAASQGVELAVVERDYAQSYVLHGIANNADLQDSLIFKGGTALKKIHLTSHRFSEDLDFSTADAPSGPALDGALTTAMAMAQSAAQTSGDVRFSVERHEERDEHPGGQEAFKLRVQFPWQSRPMFYVKVEITHDELIIVPAQVLPVIHGYGDESFNASVRSYALEEIVAEKLRASRQTLAKLQKKSWARPRARDYYDLWKLVQLDPGRIDWSTVATILAPKCRHRGVAIERLDDVFDDRVLDNVRAGWERTLGPFVDALPDVDQVLGETRTHLTRLLKL